MGVMNKLMGFLGLDNEEYIEETVEEQREEQDSSTKRQPAGRANNVVPFQAREKEGIRLILCEPRHYSDAQDIADNLRHRRPVVVNLHRVEKDQAKRIIDFLSGTVYALNGDIQKVGDTIFVCTPDHVDIQGTISSVIEE
ncbi:MULTISPECIES: cell division protein SepF [Brevibacillus]|uniref:cell division protein SepF n=1 Tax=Brevibacillus TaxID=55080 RepID=UPI0020412840|nr:MULTISPECIES: cell division protein SepF [Brevibacillus]MCM3078463.1 cell division protein SepF [Brevibacillus invocatus]MCM3428382.1 cell division protein SepF [Brevibacillus invocatus]MDH4616753.1 cell division protein SepF [Brevibacillus sp. AY1]